MADNKRITQEKDVDTNLWGFLTTFWDYLVDKDRELFEGYWKGLRLATDDMANRATRFFNASAPETSEESPIDNYYEIQLGPMSSKPLMLDPTGNDKNYIIRPLGKVLVEPEYENDLTSIYNDMIKLSANDYYKIRDVGIGCYAIVKSDNKNIDDEYFKILNLLSSEEAIDRKQYAEITYEQHVGGTTIPTPTIPDAWWVGDNNSDDSIGSNNLTWLATPNYDGGNVGQKYFNPSGDNELLFPLSITISDSTAFAIEGNIIPTQDQGEFEIKFTKADMCDLTIGIGANSDPYFQIEFNQGANYNALSVSAPDIPIGEWTSWRVEYNGGSSSTSWKLYLNDILQTNDHVSDVYAFDGILNPSDNHYIRSDSVIGISGAVLLDYLKIYDADNVLIHHWSGNTTNDLVGTTNLTWTLPDNYSNYRTIRSCFKLTTSNEGLNLEFPNFIIPADVPFSFEGNVRLENNGMVIIGSLGIFTIILSSSDPFIVGISGDDVSFNNSGWLVSQIWTKWKISYDGTGLWRCFINNVMVGTPQTKIFTGISAIPHMEIYTDTTALLEDLKYYGPITPADLPAGWWKGNDNPNDSVGTNNAEWIFSEFVDPPEHPPLAPTYADNLGGRCFELMPGVSGSWQANWTGLKINNLLPYGLITDDYLELEFLTKYSSDAYGSAIVFSLMGKFTYEYEGHTYEEEDMMFNIHIQNGYIVVYDRYYYGQYYSSTDIQPDTQYTIKIIYSAAQWDLYVDNIKQIPDEYLSLPIDPTFFNVDGSLLFNDGAPCTWDTHCFYKDIKIYLKAV